MQKIWLLLVYQIGTPISKTLFISIFSLIILHIVFEIFTNYILKHSKWFFVRKLETSLVKTFGINSLCAKMWSQQYRLPQRPVSYINCIILYNKQNNAVATKVRNGPKKVSEKKIWHLLDFFFNSCHHISSILWSPWSNIMILASFDPLFVDSKKDTIFLCIKQPNYNEHSNIFSCKAKHAAVDKTIKLKGV